MGACPALGDDASLDAGPPTFDGADSAAQWLTDHYDEAKNIVPLLTQAIRRCGVLIGQAHQLGQADIEASERQLMADLQSARDKVYTVQDQIDDIVGFWKNALGLGFAWIPLAVVAAVSVIAVAVYEYHKASTMQVQHKDTLDALLKTGATPGQVAAFDSAFQQATNSERNPFTPLITIAGVGLAAYFLLPVLMKKLN